MTICLLAFTTDIFYWVLILASFTVFFLALLQAVETTDLLGKYSSVFVTGLFLFIFLGLLELAGHNKLFSRIDQQTCDYFLITLILFASFPVRAIVTGVLLGILEMLQNKNTKSYAKELFDEKPKSPERM
jgi:hypothetical protein